MLNKLNRILDIDGQGRHDIKRENTNLRYYRDELRTHPSKKELVRFVFEHAYLWDGDWEAQYFTYLQASYLIPQERLEDSPYFRYLFVEQAMDNFFYLSEDKVRKHLGNEAYDELVRLINADSFLFSEDLRLTFTDEFNAYKAKMTEAIREHGLENLIYTYEEYLNPDIPIQTELPVFDENNVFPEIAVYIKKLVPEFKGDFVYQTFFPALIKEMEELIWKLDKDHSLKVHYLKNLRLLNKNHYVGMDLTIKQKQKNIAAMQPTMFEHLKR